MSFTCDPTLTVPAHVIEAARLIHNYFAEHGTDSWELMGICSRDRLAKAEEALRQIRNHSGLDKNGRPMDPAELVYAFYDLANEALGAEETYLYTSKS